MRRIVSAVRMLTALVALARRAEPPTQARAMPGPVE
jgi:hypothetical protein